MNILQIGILIFTIIEVGNIVMLYFKPDSRIGNGIGVFNAWEKSKQDSEIHEFAGYLVNWVAGTKLIFIMVAIVVIILGNPLTQLFTIIVLIISILSFFWRLYPTILRMDRRGEVTPKGYSKTLLIMITGFIVVYLVVLLVYFL